jgi:hypothetical protein
VYQLTLSKFSDGTEKAVLPGYSIGKDQEGCILVAVNSSGQEYVNVSSGAAGEVPVGFAHPDNTQRSTQVVLVETILPTATNSVTFQGQPNIVSGSTRIYDNTTSAAIPLGTGTNSYAVNTTTGVFTVDTADCGHDVTITYRWQLTVLAAQFLDYQRSINRSGTGTFSQVTCLNGEGIIYTDQFYASHDYSTYGATTDLRLGANGSFCVGGSGTKFGRVVAAPTTAVPFLGVAYSVREAAY